MGSWIRSRYVCLAIAHFAKRGFGIKEMIFGKVSERNGTIRVKETPSPRASSSTFAAKPSCLNILYVFTPVLPIHTVGFLVSPPNIKRSTYTVPLCLSAL